MALKPTIYKVELNLVDLVRDHYGTYPLTLACHPSEQPKRMLLRALLYGLHYHPDLQFSRGISSTDEPDLWQVSPDQTVPLWIELGQASPERMRKAISRAERVLLYAFGDETDIWWKKQALLFNAMRKLEVWRFYSAEVANLDSLLARTMQLTLTVSEGELMIASESEHLTLRLERLTEDQD